MPIVATVRNALEVHLREGNIPLCGKDTSTNPVSLFDRYFEENRRNVNCVECNQLTEKEN